MAKATTTTVRARRRHAKRPAKLDRTHFYKLPGAEAPRTMFLLDRIPVIAFSALDFEGPAQNLPARHAAATHPPRSSTRNGCR